MKVYKSLRTRIQYSIYLWTQTRMRIWENLRRDMDEIFWDLHLSGHYACSLDGPHHGCGPNRDDGIMMSQSPGTEHYVPVPGVSQEAVDTR